MKKIIFIFLAVAAFVYAACGHKTENISNSQDTTSVDSLEIADSIVCPD